MISLPLVALLTDVDDVTRESARREAERELVRPEYHHTPPLLVRVAEWLLNRLGDLLDKAEQAAPGGGWGLLGLVLLLVGLVVVVRRRFGALAQTSRRGLVFTGEHELTAAAHREAAERAAAVADWPTAVRERFRAVVRSLEERTVLEPRLGRTADEAAGEAGLALPAAAAELAAAARVFDEVVYGGRAAAEHGYRIVAAADAAVAATAMVLT